MRATSILVPVPLLLLTAAAGAQGGPAEGEIPFLEFAHEDPAKIVTAEKCGECHHAELAVWEKTPHATGFRTLHRKERAEEIAGKLGFRLIKRQSFCYSCHYTPILDEGSVRVISGVSCESCHGAGRDWVEVHNDYGSAGEAAAESAAHRAARIERSRAAGMRRPSDLYPVVSNCFGCHTVPNERLVNEGGHATGSAGFEFVEWSQGEIRHNFLESVLAGRPPANAERPASRRREMYVVGRAVELEYSLRGMARATAPGIYAKAMARRVRAALAEVRAIGRAAGVPEVERMVAAVAAARVVPGREDELLAAAERIGEATRAFLQRADGERLAALDPLLEGRDLPAEELVTADAGRAVAGREETAGAAAPSGDTTAAAAAQGVAPSGVSTGAQGGARGAATPSSGGSDPRAAAARPAAPAVTGAPRRRLRPPSDHRTLGPGACSGCHEEANAWWFGDPHYRSADPFFDGDPRRLQLARLYGLSPSEITRGDRLCMDCHGTILSGKESREVLDGVSCESCHGAAADWLAPHKEGKGRDRPGFRAALAAGKRDLRGPSARAAACADCHYVTDPRLLSSGHPSGREFDYLEAFGKIRHWPQETVPAAELRAALAAELGRRGPVPAVRVAAAAPAPSSQPAPARAGTRAAEPPAYEPVAEPTAVAAAAVRRRTTPALDPPSPRPAALAATGAVAGATAERPAVTRPAPDPLAGGGTIEDTLIDLGERLRRLYARAGAERPPA